LCFCSGGTIIIASILGALVVAGGIAVFAGAVVASPLLAGLAIRRRNNRRRNLKEIAEMHQHDRQRIKEIRSSGEDVLGIIVKGTDHAIFQVINKFESYKQKYCDFDP